MYDSIYWIFSDFAANEVGRGIILGSISGIIAMPKYFLGAFLKKHTPSEVNDYIPSILTISSLILAAIVLAPLKQSIPNITFTELMLVSGLGTAVAKNVNDTTKLKKERTERNGTTSLPNGEISKEPTLL